LHSSAQWIDCERAENSSAPVDEQGKMADRVHLCVGRRALNADHQTHWRTHVLRVTSALIQTMMRRLYQITRGRRPAQYLEQQWTLKSGQQKQVGCSAETDFQQKQCDQ
jgi:hypothetical protein